MLCIEVSKIKTLLSALTIGQEQLSILIQSKSQLAFAEQQGRIKKFRKNINSRLQQLESVLKHVTDSINHLSHQQQQMREQNERAAKTFGKEVAKKSDLQHYNKIAQLWQSVINKQFNCLEDGSKHNSIQLHNIGGAIKPQIYTIESNTVSANNWIEHIELCLGRLVVVKVKSTNSTKTLETNLNGNKQMIPSERAQKTVKNKPKNIQNH
jgi:predicted RNase H-like nuclease (RuvC/YqgF family)